MCVVWLGPVACVQGTVQYGYHGLRCPDLNSFDYTRAWEKVSGHVFFFPDEMGVLEHGAEGLGRSSSSPNLYWSLALSYFVPW